MSMASDILSILSPSKTVNPSKVDSRDRPVSLSTGATDNRFDKMLGTARARRLDSNPTSMAPPSNQSMRASNASHHRSAAEADRPAPTSGPVQEERPATQSEQKPVENADRLDEARGETNPEDQSQSAPSDYPSASIPAGAFSDFNQLAPAGKRRVVLRHQSQRVAGLKSQS